MIKLDFRQGETNVIQILAKEQSLPGRISLDKYDPEFLQITSIIWYPPNEASSVAQLEVSVLPLKTGSTTASGTVQLNQLNPLFERIIFDITISS